MPERIPLRPDDRLTRAKLTVNCGWSDNLAGQLVEASRQREMLRRTPTDAAERFYDLETANEWFETRQPTVYSLAQAAELAGIIWYERQQRPDIQADYTFAIRMYDSVRGRHLAEPFARAAHADFSSSHTPKGVWLDTEMADSSARNLYRKLGYTIVRASSAHLTMRL